MTPPTSPCYAAGRRRRWPPRARPRPAPAAGRLGRRRSPRSATLAGGIALAAAATATARRDCGRAAAGRRAHRLHAASSSARSPSSPAGPARTYLRHEARRRRDRRRYLVADRSCSWPACASPCSPTTSACCGSPSRPPPSSPPSWSATARTRAALEAAWKYVVLCSVGVAIAFLGTVCVYAAAVAAGAHGVTALDWTHLTAHADQLDPALMRLAAGLVLLGFGTKAGLAPMHAWLPDAHSQAPAPVSALMSGVLLSVAFYAILRYQAIADAVLGPGFIRTLLLAAALASLAVAAALLIAPTRLQTPARLLLHRAHGPDRAGRRDRRPTRRWPRRCCTSSATAWPRRSPSAAPARSCTSTAPPASPPSAAWPPAARRWPPPSALGRASRCSGCRRSACSPPNSASPAPASPPASAGRWPSRSSCCWSRSPRIARHAAAMLLGPPSATDPDRRRRPCAGARWRPLASALAAAAVLGIAARPAAPTCSTPPPPSPEAADMTGTAITDDRRRRRTPPTCAAHATRLLGDGLPARAGRRPPRHAEHPAACHPRRLPVHRRPARPARRAASAHRPRPTRASPAWPPSPSRPAGSSARCATCTASNPTTTRCPAALVHHPHWPAGWHPMRHDAGPPPAARPPTQPFPFLDRRRRRRLRDPGRPRPRRTHRTRPLPLLRRRRDHPQTQGPALVRPQRHREALRGPAPSPTASRSPSGSAATPPSDTPSPTASPSRTPLGIDVPAQAPAHPRRCCSSWNACTTTSPTSAPSATTSAYGIAHAHAQRIRETPAAPQQGRPPATGCSAAASIPAAPPCAPSPTPPPSTAIAADIAEIVDIALGQQRRPRPVHRHRRPHPAAGRATSAPSATSPAPAASPSTPGATTRSPTSATRFTVPVADRRRRAGPVPRPRRRDRRLRRPARRPAAARSAGTPATRRAARRHRPATAGRRHRRRLARHHRPPRRDSTPTARLTRVKIVDPSFFNWPALPVALADTIVPDFPLANKSFNLSYAGNDL